ncbi:MAG TPA: RluA family pseudouridine synthase [Flavobacteriales bacterium]|nr:RluA family pseudouridine synthase [Flavobacteriales bacterium]HIB77267.1 RluA family pseudouridine synthase [Flavobacteriales bacterium]HIO16399.1 RluA family pseudouridine synthase [Flavobacteriales bacterium]HIO59017.1 RluA family pseudouridine synthase [Flavobacteriales bacterium]
MRLICNMTEVIISKWKHAPFVAEKKRLQEGAIGQFSALPSRKSVKKAIINGRFYVKGKVATTATLVAIGDKIYLKQEVINTEIECRITDIENKNKDVIWEDEYCACVVKRGGIITKGNHKVTLEKTYSNILYKSNLKDSFITPIAIHRLDKATHGPVIFAKTLTAAGILSEAFSKREIIKNYIALVADTPMFSKATIQIKIDDKEAISEVEVVGSTNWPIYGTASLVKVNPKTGRTHQIRRHLAISGHPIVGDYLYGKTNKYTGQGLFLACTGLVFNHPITGEGIKIEVDLPRKFKHIIHKLSLY